MAQSHWGRPAPDYFSTYSLTTATRTPPPTEFEEFVLNGQALDVIRRIYLLLNKKEGLPLDIDSLARQIPLSWLTTILDATRSPSSFILLTGEMLIAVCIKLMSAIKHLGKCSPFSYEYGYVCFRIVMIAVGVNLLHRAEELKNTTNDMESRSGVACLEVFSDRISKLILDAIRATTDVSYYDFILGWAPWNHRECKKPLVGRSDSSLLSNLLYNDRKLFLEVLTPTYSPGLPGVYLVLWRHWRLENTGSEQRDSETGLSQASLQLSDLVWRYCLLAPPVQELSMSLIYKDMAPTEMIKERKPSFVDVEDSQNIVRIYADRLPIQAESSDAPFYSITSGVLFNFVRHHVTFGAMDMIPLLFRNIVRHGWHMIVYGQLRGYEPLDQTVTGTRMVLTNLANMLETIEPISNESAEELVECALQEDLLGLITRLIFEIEPRYEPSNEQSVLQATILVVAAQLYRIICSPLPRSLIKAKFNNTFHDWLKCELHFEWRLYSTSALNSPEWKHWLHCTDFYIQIRDAMQQQDTKASPYVRPCAYARCPNPGPALGAQYVCIKCGTFYCSARCQDADWKCSSWQKSHRDQCSDLLGL